MAHGRVALEVSLHDAAWGADGMQFLTLRPRSEPLVATPAEGPAHAPATTLVVGVDLGSGFEYACRPRPAYP